MILFFFNLYYIGGGDFKNVSGIFLQKIDTIAKAYKGKIFDSTNTKNLTGEILKFFEDKGYPFAKARFVSFLKKGDTLDYVMEIYRGRLGFIEGIDFNGIKRVNKNEIKKILRFRPQIFSSRLISNIKNKFYFFPYLTYENYYFFESVKKIFLDIVLIENLSNSIEGGLGYSNKSKDLFGNIRIHIDALFGSLRNIDLIWRRIKKGEQDFSINYEEPLFYFLDMKLKGGYLLTQRDTFYTKENFDATIYFLVYPFKLGVGGSYEENRDFISAKKEYRLLNIAEVEGGRKEYFKSGFYIFLNSKYSGNNYFRIYGISETRKVFDFYGILGRFFYVSVRKKEELLNSEYFYIGGKDNLRGYEEEEFKVKETFILNFENYLTLSKIFSPILFFDSGILRKDYIKFSYGFGIFGERKNLSYKILIAFPYKESIYNTKLHFSVVQYF